jgi:hypothetical protein
VAWHTLGVFPARLAAVLSLLGGALWIVHALLGGGSDPLASTLHFVGLACLLAASAVFGATLVKSDAVAMRVVVALASGLLTLSLIEAFRPADTPWYDGFWGVVAALIGGISLLRGRGNASGRPSAGAHAR